MVSRNVAIPLNLGVTIEIFGTADMIRSANRLARWHLCAGEFFAKALLRFCDSSSGTSGGQCHWLLQPQQNSGESKFLRQEHADVQRAPPVRAYPYCEVQREKA